MACLPSCPSEELQFDEASPGPVADDEPICRGAYGPNSHYKNSGSLKPAVIRFRDLIAGELSIWRLRDRTDSEKDEIVKILQSKAPPSNRLWDLLSAYAGEVRALRANSRPDDRVFHVIDDCETGEGKHPKHAAIGICQSFNPSSFETDTPLYVEIRDELFNLLQRKTVWSLPAAERGR